MTARSNLPLDMTRGARNAVVFLFVLNLLLIGVSLLWTAHEVNAVASRFTAASRAEQARGAVVQRKICQTLHALDAEKPPAGHMPSRTYLRHIHTRLAELSPDLGCPPPPSGTAQIPGTRPSAAPGSTRSGGSGGRSPRPGGGVIAAPAPRPGSPVIVPGPVPSPVPPVTVTTTATVPGSPPPSSPPPRRTPCIVRVISIRVCV